jgi:mRNA interferase MazF
MGTSSVVNPGTVVLVRFPFSDLSASKLRPAVVLAELDRQDFILVQITSQPYADPRSIQLEESSFRSGGLQRTSFARPGKLFTAHASLIDRSVGLLTKTALESIRSAVVRVISGAPASAR